MGYIDLYTMVNICIERLQTWNLIIKRFKWSRIGHVSTIVDAEKYGILHPLEESLEES